MTTLGYKLAPGLGEPPHGLASRLARIYDIKAADFCRDMGISMRSLVDGDLEAMAAFARLVGQPLGEISAYAMTRSGNDCVLRGQLVTRDVIRRHRLHCCPMCLVSDPTRADLTPDAGAYVRATWLVEPIRTCAEHGMALVPVDDLKDTSGLEIHDLAERLSSCTPRRAAMLDAAARRPASRFEQYLLARIDHGGPQVSSWIDGLAFHVAAKACEMIGAVALYGRMPNLRTLTQDEWWAAGAAGYEIVSEGPSAIREFLTGLQRTYDYKAGAGPQAVFGRIYQWLAYAAAGQNFDPLRDLVAEHIIETIPLAAGEQVLGRTVDRRTLHSIHSAALETGLHPKRLRRLLAAAGHVPPEAADQARRQTDHRVVFDADAVSEFLAQATDQLSLTKAGHYLNAPRVQIRLIADAGFIRPIVGSKPGWQRAFARSELDRFLDTLKSSVTGISVSDNDKASIPTAAKKANCSAVEIIQSVLDGSLTYVGSSDAETGYLSVLVDVAEVKRLTRGADLNGVPCTALKGELGIGDRTARALVQNGILVTRMDRHPVNRCPVEIISRTDIDAFRAEYITLFAVAAQSGMHFRAVKALLEDRQIAPRFPRDLVFCAFYLRQDVIQVFPQLAKASE